MKYLIGKILVLILVGLMPGLLMAQEKKVEEHTLLVGTYTSGKSEGFYLYCFDVHKGKLVEKFVTKGVKNPSFVVFGPGSNVIYAVNELNDNGAVSAYSFDKAKMQVEFLNRQPSKGGSPCYLRTTSDGKFLFVGNYMGGNLSVYAINDKGKLCEPLQTITHEGSSVNSNRQEKPHVHSTVLSPDEKKLFVCDLGTDKIYSYDFDAKNKIAPLKPAQVPFTEVKPGSGPRHLIFDKKGDYVYVVFELTAEIGVFRHKKEELEHIQTIAMVEESFTGDVSGAEVRMSPDGKFLYASNRGDANEIVIYSIDKKNGKLTFAGRQSSMGKTPRNFIMDPSGKYLLVANQNSDNIVIFRRNEQTGLLKPTGEQIEVGNPVYLFME